MKWPLKSFAVTEGPFTLKIAKHNHKHFSAHPQHRPMAVISVPRIQSRRDAVQPVGSDFVSDVPGVRPIVNYRDSAPFAAGPHLTSLLLRIDSSARV